MTDTGSVHKRAAEEWLDGAGAPNPTVEETLMFTAIAQAHATLYLAEQQEIANLIAYVAHRAEHRDATGGRDAAPALRSLLASVDLNIREGLGL